MKIVYVKSINEYIDAIKNNNEILIADYFYDEFFNYLKDNKAANKLNEMFYNFYIAANKKENKFVGMFYYFFNSRNKTENVDVSASISFLEKEAFESKNKDAYYFLGCVYKNNVIIAFRDNKKALTYLEKAIECGSSLSLYELGEMYYKGNGVPQSYEEAIKYFKKAADNNHVVAQFILGEIYYDGEAVNQSYAEAAKWYQKAADNNYAQAQNILGVM